MAVNKEKYIGIVNNNNRGTMMKIIDYRKNEDMDVQFLDEYKYVAKNVAYINFKNGCIKNPYDKTVFGIGYMGEGNYLSNIKGNNTDVYNRWYEMMERCYGKVRNDRHRAYYGICTVCEEWHCFQTFAKWNDLHTYQCEGRLHVDKDILIPGNKIYSPETCILVPQRINMLFMNKSNKRGLPNGISQLKNGYYNVKYAGDKVGNYKTFDEACAAYSIRKEEVIKETANEYKDIIPASIYNALMNYKVDITIDRNYVA